MSDPPSVLERFNRWFVAPLELLKTLPDGDGAFIALSIGCSLCERYYREKTNTQDLYRNKSFLSEAVLDLNIVEEPNKTFEIFWDIYRNGMQHQGTPKTTPKYKWRISNRYKSTPEFKDEDNFIVILLNPWGFADLMVEKFLSNPDTLANALQHTFGDIFPSDISYISEEKQRSFPPCQETNKQRPSPLQSLPCIPATGVPPTD